MLTYIAGYGDHAKVVYQVATENKIIISGFLKVPLKNLKNNRRSPKKIYGLPVINYKKIKKNSNIYIGLGNIKERVQIFKFFKKKKFNLLVLKSEKAIIHKNVKIGEGSLILPGVIININANIGKNTIINSGSIIEHDVRIKDNVNISPGTIVCGNSIIGEESFIGAGTIIQNQIKIGKNCIIGSGSNIIRDIKKNSIVYGSRSVIK